MNQTEFEHWQKVMDSSKYRWVEDVVARHNGHGSLYYTGGEDGIYMRISAEGKLTIGEYKDAFPHIGEATFIPKAEHQYDSYSKAFEAACKLGGVQFLADMFSNVQIPQEPIPTDESDSNGMNMEM
ncbi:MAG: hypothetical protein Q4C12_01620 [Clostridia bacterium]|nr:hypothetical protein [Clostridia bacterium]